MIMPRRITERLVSVDGKSTELGKEIFLKKAAEIRKRIMAEKPTYRSKNEEIFSSDYYGTLSRPAAGYSKRKGREMPKLAGTVNNVVSVAGKRGRKAEFNPSDWVMDIGVESAFDVTDEMNSGIEKIENCTFDSDDLFGNDNSDANQYRGNRFGAFKRAAVIANGKDSKYELAQAENEDGNSIWLMIRTK